MHAMTFVVGARSGDVGRGRIQVGRPRPRLLTARRVAVVVAAAAGLPWLPLPEAVPEVRPMQLARGRPGASIVTSAMSPDGRLVAAVDDRGMVVLRPVDEDGGLGRRVEVPGFARAVAFAPDGRRLAVGREQTGVVIRDLERGEVGRVPGNLMGAVSDLRLRRMGGRWRSPAVIGRDPAVGRAGRTTADVAAGSRAVGAGPGVRARRPLAGLGLPVCAAGPGLGPGGRTGASDCPCCRGWSRPRPSRRQPDPGRLDRDAGGGLHLRRPDRGAPADHRRPRPAGPALAFAPDGRILATAGHDGTVGLFNPETGRELVRLDGLAATLSAVAFSPDGRTLLAVGNDDDIRTWDLRGSAGSNESARRPAWR